jgi:hypothetical protein
MGRIRSLAAQTPAIAISVLAVALSMGGGAYAATQAAGHAQASHTAITAGVSWNSISLINGWTSENATFSSGNPKVAIQSNIVYLSGSLHQATPGNEEFGVLPSQFRPTHNMWIAIYTVDDSVGTLFIGKDGTLEAFSPGACGSGDTAQCYTSLAGVSYPINS